ncbi:TraR/DksA C4-type zinc finger protein [Roseococcus pinisoli]|uniref:TraR/DksA C4-type zinc finger protein n=1 Tax=Roseococcus pinisoli TaxID=2835040 RepID=A0ABS5Q9X4_9PROT|nr:TraR/DksA C4-type zinc finger protein [Roseococcus pinisoli]MBS7810507.1 TraR/DksA C4-type zinc finger protein [Roseococcus pinisoli]
MADDMDRAAELTELQTAAHIAAARPASGPGSRYCVDCDVEIPQRRRDKHPSAIRCVPCQETMEAPRVR